MWHVVTPRRQHAVPARLLLNAVLPLLWLLLLVGLNKSCGAQ
jgi:hypothetical protein